MEQYLRPQRFDCNPSAADAAQQWNHWFRTFTTFLRAISCPTSDELDYLINYLSHPVYQLISNCNSYEDAISVLQSLYVKPKNVIYARHMLATCKQEPGQTIDEFLQKLDSFICDCDFQAVTAEEHRDQSKRDAFITGLHSHPIRQRILERTLSLRETADLARSLEMAQKQSQSYLFSTPCGASTDTSAPISDSKRATPNTEVISSATNEKCYFCGNRKHPRFKCPARDAICNKCGRKGHFQSVCRSTNYAKGVASTCDSSLASIITAAAPQCLSNAVVKLQVNGVLLQALVDTGSSESYISADIVRKHHWLIEHSQKKITMASTALTSSTLGHCYVSITYKNVCYRHIKLSVLPSLCSDVLLGHDFFRLHSKVEIPFGGDRAPFSVCAVSAAHLEPPLLFEHLAVDCHPIATKSRRHSATNEHFIHSEIQKLLNDGVIEPSRSPWRAQVLVTTNERHKKRMVVDYSQTINRYTYLDAYPLPRIDHLIQKISRYTVFTTLDLQSAYHQIPIREEERKYTAFEACGSLYQFCRIPFGVTNGVSCFQRSIDDLLKREQVRDTFAYIDNITVCGKNITEHDENLLKFLNVAQKYGITFNEDKSIVRSQQVTLLGYEVSFGVVKPDPERFSALRSLPPPNDIKSQQRIVGMFAYYAQWIPRFSDKIHLLVQNRTFPLPEECLTVFVNLKAELEKASLVTVDPGVPLSVETDASDIALAATLNQNGRPIAFFSRTLSVSEKHYSSVEKEAHAIIEAVRRWRHYLFGTTFQLITDQRSVAFMYDLKHQSKIKNEKVERWRIELSTYKFDVVYRPGRDNLVADTLSRDICSSICSSNLRNLHDSLCHPGIARMAHFVRTRNLPYSIDDIRSTITNCAVCAELKPRFFRPSNLQLIKATQPFERLSVDFKGPLPSATRNKYLLTIIDEYSRFPFAFPCPDMSSRTIITCFCQLFSLFGMPSYIHSDRGSSFLSVDLTNFLHTKGIATSRTTAYNPQGNGQVERLNGTLWKTISLALKSHGLPTEQWELVLQDALHSIRSLLCTATNVTPHERLFQYHRKSTSGTSLPTWLLTPGPVLMKRNVRSSKYEPLVDEVELLECNPRYAHVRLPDGREETVSLRQLAPTPSADKTLVNDLCIQPRATERPSSPSETQFDSDLPTTISDNIQLQPSNPNDNTSELIHKQQRVHPYHLRNREA